MSFFQTSETRPDRPARSWLLETMVVLGILAFGYFAITLESGSQSSPPPQLIVNAG